MSPVFLFPSVQDASFKPDVILLEQGKSPESSEERKKTISRWVRAKICVDIYVWTTQGLDIDPQHRQNLHITFNHPHTELPAYCWSKALLNNSWLIHILYVIYIIYYILIRLAWEKKVLLRNNKGKYFIVLYYIFIDTIGLCCCLLK